jgi:hypothetical protein
MNTARKAEASAPDQRRRMNRDMNRGIVGIGSWTTGRPVAALAFGLVLLLALLARVQPWRQGFQTGTPGAVFVGDTDTYYHALRAERMAANCPRDPWTDGGMNFPLGADNLRPPLFDATVAGISRLAAGGPTSTSPSRCCRPW